MHAALSLAEQPEGPYGSVTHPGGQWGPFDRGNQVSDVPMRTLMIVRVRMPVRVVWRVLMRSTVRVGNERRWMLACPIREHDIDLGRLDAAALDLVDLHANVGEPQSEGQPTQPFGRRPSGQERAEKHIAADASGWIEDGKTTVSHRLINMAGV